jgi:hypothetical protein
MASPLARDVRLNALTRVDSARPIGLCQCRMGDLGEGGSAIKICGPLKHLPSLRSPGA